MRGKSKINPHYNKLNEQHAVLSETNKSITLKNESFESRQLVLIEEKDHLQCKYEDLRKEMDEFAVQQERNAALDHQIENEMREMRLNIKKPTVHKVKPLFFFNLKLGNFSGFIRS